MRYSSLAVSMLTLVAALPAAMAAPSLDEVKQKMNEAWEKQTALQADARLEALLPVGENRVELTGEGDVKIMKLDDMVKYRQELMIELPPPVTSSSRLEVLYDGEFVYTTNEMMGQRKVTREKPGLGQGTPPPGGTLLLEVLENELDLKAEGEEKLNGRDAWVLEGTPKGVEDTPFTLAQFWVDKKTGMLLKTELYESENVKTATLRYTNINTNPDLGPEEFEAPSMEATEPVPGAPAEEDEDDAGIPPAPGGAPPGL